MFKVNNKDTRTTPKVNNKDTITTSVNFEQVNADWVG